MSSRAIDGAGNLAPVITASTYGSDLNRPGYPDENFVTGIREQLSDIISDISPTETPFFTKCGKQSAKNTYTEWQTTTLQDAELNAHIEGADSGAEFNKTERVGNYTQIGKRGFRVSSTVQSVDTAGRDREYAYQALQKGKELKRDLEVALLGTQGRDAGSGASPRIMCGVGGWISTNTAGDATFPTAGDGSGGFTAGTGAAFNQDDFDELLETLWTEGGEPDRVYLRADLMSAAVAALEGNNNQRGNIQATEEKVVNSMVRYQTPWGLLTFVPDRFMPAGSVYVLESAKWKVATLRGWKQEKLAKTGDSMHGHVVGEHTLISENEAASGHMATYTKA
jgi:hypothetical protein